MGNWARRGAVVGLVCVGVAGLAGCSNAGGTTCEQFNAQDVSTQTGTLHNLLTEHDLEPSDYGNVQGVTAAVSALCGSNSSATLDEATDWNAATW